MGEFELVIRNQRNRSVCLPAELRSLVVSFTLACSHSHLTAHLAPHRTSPHFVHTKANTVAYVHSLTNLANLFQITLFAMCLLPLPRCCCMVDIVICFARTAKKVHIHFLRVRVRVLVCVCCQTCLFSAFFVIITLECIQ